VPGYSYVIQAATDLTQPNPWTNLATGTADINGAFSFTDSAVSNYNCRYYRTVVQ